VLRKQRSDTFLRSKQTLRSRNSSDTHPLASRKIVRSWSRACVLRNSPNETGFRFAMINFCFCFCEGFRMTADRDDAACTGAVVRKPPVKERAGDELPTVRRALWRFDRGVDGERKARERGGQVMAGAGGSRVRLSTDNDSFLGRLRSVRRGRAAVWSSVAVAGL
jgi:hypothetical protein